MADTERQISEAFSLRWQDVDLVTGVARIEANIDFRGKR